MALQKAPLALGFGGGVDTKTDPKQVPAIKLLNLENGVFNKTNSISKRNGYRALSRQIENGGASYATGFGLAARNNELIVFADGHGYSYRATPDRWSDTGAVSSVVASLAPIARSGTQQKNADAATTNGVTVIAYEDATLGGVYCTVLDAISKRELLAPTLLHASGERPRCVVVDQVMIVLFAVAATSRIHATVINPVIPAATPVVTIVTEDLDPGNPVYDAEIYAGASKTEALIAWSTGATGYRIGNLASTGFLGSPLTGYPSVATFTEVLNGPIAISVSAAQSQAVVAWSSAGTWFRFHTLSTFAGGYTAATGLGNAARISAAIVGASHAWIAQEASGASLDQNSATTISVSASAGIGATGTIRGHGLGARLFVDSGNVFVTLTRHAFYFPYVAVVQIPSGSGGWGVPAVAGQIPSPAARLLPGLSTGIPTRSHLPSVAISGRQYTIPLGYRIQLSSANGDQFGEAGIQLATLDFANQAAWQTAQLGQGLYLGSACTLHYDGYRWSEADFHCAPDTATGAVTTAPAAGGSLTSSGKYLYLYCYEEIDGNGELHQGPMSAGTLVTMGGTDTQVTHTIPTYMLTSRRHARIAVYRSAFNATGTIDQIDFFRVTSTDPTAGGANGYLANNLGANSVTFIDQMSDATLITKEPAYTNGGILSNDPSPFSGSAIAGGKSRLFWPDPTDGNLLRYSQQVRDETALEAPQPLSLRTDPYGGAIVGVGIMDGGVLAFCQTAIYVADGPGPDADGGKTSTNAFTPFALLTSDVGCVSNGSICQTPIGITFQSSKGIKLLGRDRQVVDIGRDVYAFNSQTIVRATLLPDRHSVIFLTDAGTTLLWDYERQEWSKFTNHQGLDAVVVGGKYYYLRTDGRVFVETPGTYVDDNSHIPLKIQTAFIKMAGYLQGFQKVLTATVLGTYKSSHKLRMRYQIDYDDAYSAPIDAIVDANYNPANFGDGNFGDGNFGGDITATTRYQTKFHINKRCESISFEFSDVEATGVFGAAFELSELLIIGGVLAHRFPVGAARSQ